MTKLLTLSGWLTLAAGFLPVVAFIVFAGARDFAFTAWNLAPVLVALAVLGFAFGRPFRRRVAALAFCVAAVGLPLYFHLAWHFDWGRTASGSSTSALAFIFVPLWSFVLAAVLYGLAWLLAGFVRRESPPSAP